MTLSDAASLVSIIVAVFALWQAHVSSVRAETLNKQTQEALTEIKACVSTIKTLVSKQQSKQIEIISSTNNRLIDTIQAYTNSGGKSNEQK